MISGSLSTGSLCIASSMSPLIIYPPKKPIKRIAPSRFHEVVCDVEGEDASADAGEALILVVVGGNNKGAWNGGG